MLLVLLCSFFLLVVSSSAQPLLFFCSNSTISSSPTDKIVRDSQLQLLLSNLTGAVSTSPFFFASGNSSNKTAAGPLFFLAQCRPDLSSPDCSTCILRNIQFLTTITPFHVGCPFSRAASIRVDECLLRYSDLPFLGNPAEGGDDIILLSDDSATDPAAFEESTWQLLQKLVDDAAQSPSRFAVGESGGVYGMAWCTLDLTDNFCSDCLKSKISGMQSASTGAQSVDFRCLLRYEPQIFYYTSAAPAPHPSAVPEEIFNNVGSLRPTAVEDNGNNKRSCRIVLLMVGIALATVLSSI